MRSEASKNLSEYVLYKGILFSTISERTGIPYQRIFNSLSKTQDSELNPTEFLKVCQFIEKDPSEFSGGKNV